MKYIKRISVFFLLIISFSCNKFIDVIPDNIVTLDHAFKMRHTAEQYLFTCYNYTPAYNDFGTGFINVGDELIYVTPNDGGYGYDILRGRQNANAPILDYWNGASGTALYRGIRDCNIFLENVDKVPDFKPGEKEQWIAEVKFLKAYYHYFLMILYGPIPIVKENIPVAAQPDEVRVTRRPVDEVVTYISELIDEAVPDLPLEVRSSLTDAGRITKPIALSIKAKMLVYAASPLFNGNTDYSDLKNHDGTVLIDQQYKQEKWEKAAQACKEAIDACHQAKLRLFKFAEHHATFEMSPETINKLTIRSALTERWNDEVIWANTNTRSFFLQSLSLPRKIDPKQFANYGAAGSIGVPLKVTDLFYTNNGVPIEEDLTWGYNQRFQLRTAVASEKNLIKEGYETAKYNFDRETRFYADLGFDGGIWYGLGYKESESLYLRLKYGQTHGKDGPWFHAITGYYPKKYVNYESVLTGDVSFQLQDYPWPVMRLADLYLLYAEALNESQGPVAEVFTYLDLIRERASLKGVKESWTNHSRNPSKFATKDGLREIIHQERGIELAFEAQRHFDLRRWKKAMVELNKPITGWDMDQSLAAYFYRERTYSKPVFELKDYLWPLREYDLVVNKNLVQNPGW